MCRNGSEGNSVECWRNIHAGRMGLFVKLIPLFTRSIWSRTQSPLQGAVSSKNKGPRDRRSGSEKGAIRRSHRTGSVRRGAIRSSCPKAGRFDAFFVDYRRLNTATLKDTYPLPRMDEYFESLGDTKAFSALDAISKYWQMPIPESDRDKTALTCHLGL